VGVWGPGGLGRECIREIARLPELELAGVFAYADAKHGVDAGDLAGIARTGVTATTDRSTFLEAQPECVLFVARDEGNFGTDDDILALLGAGVNVVTPLPYRRLDLRGIDVAERFRATAEAGRASFACVGLNPDFFSERLAATMSGLSNGITRIHLRELFRMDGSVGDEMLGIVGFGAALDDPEAGLLLATLARSYDVPSMTDLAERLGRPIEWVEVTNKSVAAPRDIDFRDVHVDAGTIGMLGICFDGYVDGAPFITFENFYYLTDVMRPDGATVDEHWTLTIDGRPSLRVTVEALDPVAPSARTDGHGEVSTPGYLATVVAMVQAIPHVVDGPPGLIEPFLPTVHWRSDMRRLSSTTSAGVGGA
jgi:hypothetical protein